MWGWGANSCGQLGLHQSDDVLVPTRLHELEGRNVVQLAAGAAHTCALTEDGIVLVFGNGLFGQIGHKQMPLRQCEPLTLELPNQAPARLVAAGPYQTLAVTRDGGVFLLGRSLFDTRPITHDSKAARKQRTSGPYPPLVQATAIPLPFSGSLVVQAAVGLNHCLFLLEDGTLVSFGLGQHGALGHGDTKDRVQPARIAAFGDRRIEYAAVGEAFSVAQDTSGQVWVWGCDDAGELGMSGTAANRCTPIPLQHMPVTRPARRSSQGSAASGMCFAGGRRIFFVEVGRESKRAGP